MEKLHPVVVTEVKATADQETFQVRLEQIVEEDITTQAGLLGFTMGGHTKFTDVKRKRTAWQNFSKAQIEKLGLRVGKKLNDIPGITAVKLVVTETFEPRTWFDKISGEQKSQSPKTAGEGGAVLTKDGKPIYRNTSLAINGMDFTDKLIKHDPVVKTGSTDALKELEGVQAEAGEEAVPGQIGDSLPF